MCVHDFRSSARHGLERPRRTSRVQDGSRRASHMTSCRTATLSLSQTVRFMVQVLALILVFMVLRTRRSIHHHWLRQPAALYRRNGRMHAQGGRARNKVNLRQPWTSPCPAMRQHNRSLIYIHNETKLVQALHSMPYSRTHVCSASQVVWRASHIFIYMSTNGAGLVCRGRLPCWRMRTLDMPWRVLLRVLYYSSGGPCLKFRGRQTQKDATVYVRHTWRNSGSS